MNRVGWIIAGVIILWLVFGNSAQSTVAGWFWPDSSAPWESVHVFYYPNKYDLTKDERQLNVGGLQKCRDWANAAARYHNDPSMLVGDYECGIGCKPVDGDMYECRLTIR